MQRLPRHCRHPFNVMGIMCLASALGLAPSTVDAQQRDSAPASKATPSANGDPLVFNHVTIVDVEQGKLVPAQQVVIAGNHIQTVGEASTVKMPQGATVVDLRGKYLVPGLWDMHVHVLGDGEAGYLPYAAFVAAGVTGVREMSTSHLDSVLRWRREFAVGARVGPRVLTPGPSVAFGHGSDFPFNIRVSTPEEGRRVVDSLHAAGADFLKIYPSFISEMPREVYVAMMAEARRLGFPVAGHPPLTVPAAEASDSGQRSFEHLLFDVGTGVRQIGGWDSLPSADSFFSPCWRADSTGDQLCAALAAVFARNNSWFTPTLAIGARESDTTGQDQYQNVSRANFWLVNRLQRFGIPLLAGTDYIVMNANPAPEAVLRQARKIHEELALLVAAGLTPLEALRTATLNPAMYLRATDSLGTVSPGRVADLLVLDANPLTDIRNTTKVHAVVANGRYLDRATLDTLVADVTRRLAAQRRRAEERAKRRP